MKKLYFIPIFILLLTGCEKDANIKLDEMPPVPVIEGYFSNFAPDSYFKISMSKGFQRDTYEYEPVTDAQLSVTDSQGNIIHFYPDNEGVYRTTTGGVPGETYTLNLTKDAHHVTAMSNMTEQIYLNDFEFITVTQPDGDTDDQLILYFNDPDNQVDYYMIKLFFRYDNFDTFNGYGFDIYFDDKNYNRQEHSLALSYIPYDGAGDYKVKLYHLNKAYIDYLNTLDQLSNMDYGESPFQISVPGNPETNVQGGIGYFATVASDSLIKYVD